VDVVAAVGTDREASTVVEPCEGTLDDPAVASESGAVFCLAAGDARLDATCPGEAAVLVVVVAAVGVEVVRAAAWTPAPAAHGGDRLDQRKKLGDVVAVAAGECLGERDTAAVYEQVVLAAGPASVDGTGSRFSRPFFWAVLTVPWVGR